ncbi:MAG: nucleotidyltransferase family protein [Candidatus Levybacteria bacterium]|nr:nucleotidyltransferase family protein [Candidatus Levybacteria bacterium]
MTQREILQAVQDDSWMMEVLSAVVSLRLPDWSIGAGFVRNKVWDVLHGYKESTPLNDIDVIYFDEKNVGEKDEKRIEQQLKKLRPDLPWSVKNQARMALVRGDEPYKNAEDGLSRWIETATCVGVRLDKKGKLILAAPLGIDDLVELVIRQNILAKIPKKLFEKRITDKRWLTIWPKLRVI